MRNVQYFEIVKSNGANKPRVIVTKGAEKGKIGVFERGICGTKVFVRYPDDTHALIPYTSVEILDSSGKPLVAPPVDMTGRLITAGEWCVCMKNGTINVGRVTKITPAGSAVILPAIIAGERVENWRNGKTIAVSVLDHLIMLPVTNMELVEWVLKDFEEIGNV